MEGGGGNGPGNHGGLGDAGSREQSEPAAKKLLGWGNEIRLETLALQSSALGSVAVIQSKETQERICNNQCECHLGARL